MIRNALQRFMYGRYGNDQLNVFLIVLYLLLYFLSIYCVSPIERMNKSLGDWLSFRTPFNVEGDLKDEVLELKERIETLINQSKQPKA